MTTSNSNTVHLSEKDIARFWSKVDKSAGNDACWMWIAGTVEGYGRFRFNGRAWLAHRFVYFLTYNRFPSNTTNVCHHCDNPLCVNPKHLFEGTQRDNVYDMIGKGRGVMFSKERMEAHPEWFLNRPKGSQTGRAKLTEADVLEIRRLYVPHEFGHHKLAKMFGVSKHLISLIVNRKNWTHI